MSIEDDPVMREAARGSRPAIEVPEPEDDGEDVEEFAKFMRATRVPPRDTALAATADAQAGSALISAADISTKRSPVMPSNSTAASSGARSVSVTTSVPASRRNPSAS